MQKHEISSSSRRIAFFSFPSLILPYLPKSNEEVAQRSLSFESITAFPLKAQNIFFLFVCFFFLALLFLSRRLIFFFCRVDWCCWRTSSWHEHSVRPPMISGTTLKLWVIFFWIQFADDKLSFSSLLSASLYKQSQTTHCRVWCWESNVPKLPN